MAAWPDGTLMQRAATGLAVICGQLLGRRYGSRAVVLAGSGDNGGDALYAGAQLARRGVSLAEAAKVMTRYPQVLINVPVDRTAAATSPELAQAVEAAREELGSSGRILVRPSGTEPIIRVMVEAVDTAQADRVAHQVADVVRLALA